MKTPKTPDEIKAELELTETFLRLANTTAGSPTSPVVKRKVALEFVTNLERRKSALVRELEKAA